MTPDNHPKAFITLPPKKALFVCVHNAARSQIAEGFARTYAPADSEIWSAGTEPGALHPLAVEVMKEVGIDISAQHSKPLSEVPWQTADTVITLCAESDEVCPPVEATVRRVYWPLPDPLEVPEGEQLAAFREARDEIRWRITALWSPE